MTEREALNNAINSTGIKNLHLHDYIFKDKRKVNKYFLSLSGMSISPNLDYDQMNHFILGFSRANQLLNILKSL